MVHSPPKINLIPSAKFGGVMNYAGLAGPMLTAWKGLKGMVAVRSWEAVLVWMVYPKSSYPHPI
jgi:hypothetical protein